MIKKLHKLNRLGYSIYINFSDKRLNLDELKKDLKECLYYTNQFLKKI